MYSQIWALFHSRPPSKKFHNSAQKSFIFYKFCNSSMPGPPPHKLGPLLLGEGQLNGCLEMGVVPEWMTKGRTCLILKNRSKSGLVSNNRPITCLPLMWKLLTGIIGQSVYNHLEEEQILPPEQKGCRRGCRGTKDQLMIDKMILKNCRRRLTNLAVRWIDYKKAYDMVPHSWIKQCMEWFGVADNVKRTLEKSMKTWRVELTSGGAVP